MTVTGYDVAKACGVSQSTVSRALRGDTRVVPATRDLVLRTAADLGYVVNATARSLITGRTSAVAVVSGDLRNPSYPVLISTLQQQFRRLGYRVVLLSDDDEASGRFEGEFRHQIDTLRGGLVDGVVYISARTDPAPVQDLIDAGVPVTVLNRDVDAVTAPRVDRVTSDNVEGGRLAARHLVEVGCRRIALVAGPRDNPSLRRRERGFRTELTRMGLDLPRELVHHGPLEPATGRAAAESLLHGPGAADGVFCVSDYSALGVLDGARRLGRSVPGDLAVVGYNDLDWAGWSMIDLTTVRQPLSEMAVAAAHLLFARLSGDTGPAVHRTFDVELVARSTTGPLRGRAAKQDVHTDETSGQRQDRTFVPEHSKS